MSFLLLVSVVILCYINVCESWCLLGVKSNRCLASSRFMKDKKSVHTHRYRDNSEDGENYDDSELNPAPKSRTTKKLREKVRPVILNIQGKWKVLNRALLAGIFVAGIGLGVTIDSAINTNPKDLASRDAIDRNAPNPKVCAKFGSSAMVLDQRVFITFNPFNVYVTQADTKPGCVLRAANIVPLLQQDRKLLTDEEINTCKNSFNTWAYVGDINNRPQLNCVFQSEDAQNEFLSNPKIGLGEDIYDRPTESPTANPNGKLPGPTTGIASSINP